MPHTGGGSRPAPDRLRYRVIGNAMAVPVVRWLGRGLLAGAG